MEKIIENYLGKIKRKLINISISSKTKISVIIPVYNVEPYISQFIDSLKKQKMSGLEFIFIDDLGSDASMNLVENWARTDKRVKIIKNEKNIGPGPSRNKGIEIAKGQYLSFIDPDDYISSNYYKDLYAAATKNGKEHDISKGIIHTVPDTRPNHRYYLEQNDGIIKNLGSGAPLWYSFKSGAFSGLFNKRLFQNPKVRFGTTRVSEDVFFLLTVGQITNDIVIENRSIYYYVEREGSLTNDFTSSRVENLILGLEKKREALEPLGDNFYVQNYFDSHLRWFYRVVETSFQSGTISNDDQTTLAKQLQEKKKMLPCYKHHMDIIPEFLDFFEKYEKKSSTASN